jgi:hypothetical protein
MIFHHIRGDVITFYFSGFQASNMQFYFMIQRMITVAAEQLRIVQISDDNGDIELSDLRNTIPKHWNEELLKGLPDDLDEQHNQLFADMNWPNKIPIEHVTFSARLPIEFGKNAFAFIRSGDIDGEVYAEAYCLDVDTEIFAEKLKQWLGADSYKIRGGAPPLRVVNGTIDPFEDLDISA